MTTENLLPEQTPGILDHADWENLRANNYALSERNKETFDFAEQWIIELENGVAEGDFPQEFIDVHEDADKEEVSPTYAWSLAVHQAFVRAGFAENPLDADQLAQVLTYVVDQWRYGVAFHFSLSPLERALHDVRYIEINHALQQEAQHAGEDDDVLTGNVL